MKLMTKELEQELSKHPFCSTEGQGYDAECVVKYFSPCSSFTLFVIEGEKQENGDWLLFGYGGNNDENNEWGYTLLSDLEKIKLPFGLTIERDLHSSGTVRKLAKQIGFNILYDEEES